MASGESAGGGATSSSAAPPQPHPVERSSGGQQRMPGRAGRHMSLSLDVESLDEQSRKLGRRGTVCEEFTQEQIGECKDLFTMFDKNADNMIDRSEFGPMMRTLGLHLSERELDTFFERMDSSGDGNIEFSELVEFLQKIARPITIEEELTEAFRFFNPDGGDPSIDVISKKGLAKVMASMGEDISEAECGDMITAATSGSEVIDFDTFRRLCTADTRQAKRGHRTRFEEHG